MASLGLNKRPAEGEHETPVVARKSRKTSAVTKTTNRGTIKLIQQNAANSPFLSLSGEVREQILKYLLGNKSIHVILRILYEKECELVWGQRPWGASRFADSGFLHFVCDKPPMANGVEPVIVSLPGNEKPHDCHECCGMLWGAWTPWEVEKDANIEVAVLRGSRQLYEEAHQILWTSNTFVFNDSLSLAAFVAALNPAQKRKLRSLHIHADSVQCAPTSEKLNSGQNQGLTLATVNALAGLKSLSLDLRFFGYVGEPLDDLDVVIGRAALERFKPLQALPLQQVTVHLQADERLYRDHDPSDLNKLEAAAKRFREALLDSNGAQVAEDDRKSKIRPKILWTNKLIRRDYHKTKSACRKVFRNAEVEIRRRDTYEATIQQYLEANAVDRETLRTRRPSMYYNAFSFHVVAAEAEVRIRRWKRTEQKKRALCNRRLAKIPGTLQIEEPEFEDLGDESDTASDGADSNEIDKEDSDHGRSDSERQ